MRSLIILFLISFSLVKVNAKTFSQLSSKKYFTIEQNIEKDQYIDVKLLIQFPSEIKTEVPVKLIYCINKDTITEYHSLKKLYAGPIKILQVNTDDKLTVGIKLLAPNDSVVLQNIKGDLNLVESTISNSKTKLQLSLVTGYLKPSDTQIFKYELPNDSNLNLVINFNITEQFLMDSLHFQISFMLPNGSFGSQDFSLLVNQGDFLTFKDKQLVAKINNLLKFRGNYVFQLVVKNDEKYLNGIKEISLALENTKKK